MEQSLREHKDYIVELQEDSVRQTVEYDKALAEAWRDREDQRAQCLAKQLYIKHTIEQIYKAIYKAHEMFDKAGGILPKFRPYQKKWSAAIKFPRESERPL